MDDPSLFACQPQCRSMTPRHRVQSRRRAHLVALVFGWASQWAFLRAGLLSWSTQVADRPTRASARKLTAADWPGQPREQRAHDARANALGRRRGQHVLQGCAGSQNGSADMTQRGPRPRTARKGSTAVAGRTADRSLHWRRTTDTCRCDSWGSGTVKTGLSCPCGRPYLLAIASCSGWPRRPRGS